MHPIDVAGWTARLIQLAGRGSVQLMPLSQRDGRDLELVLATAALHVPQQQLVTEVQANEVLDFFLSGVGAFVDADVAELRRWLVDTGFVVRNEHGADYRRGHFPDWLAQAADHIDLDALTADLQASKPGNPAWLSRAAQAVEVTETLIATAADDEMYMRLALDQAHNAWALAEVPERYFA